MSQLNSSAPHIHNATGFEDVVDWGPQPDLLEGASHSTGRLLHKGPDNIPETAFGIARLAVGDCPCLVTSSVTLFLVARVTPMITAR